MMLEAQQLTLDSLSPCMEWRHLCFKLGTIPAYGIAYASPQSWISQETPFPHASLNLHIMAVWNTAARLHLDNTILHGCKILLATSEAN